MLILKNKIKYEYNIMYDILYLKIKGSNDSYGDENEIGIVINHDYNTDEIIGADIWDFKERIVNNEAIPLPFKVDLMEIYKEL
jgi:hypothetical protein